jgi:hypothetical protein
MTDTTPRSGFEDTRGNPDIVAERAVQWLDIFGLNENQAVFSLLGLDPIIQPRRGIDEGRGRLIDTGDLETSALLANFAVNYIPDRMKTKPRDLSETQWNMALWLLNEAAGGSAPGSTRLNNVLSDYGLDLTTQGGLGELELALAEKPSVFDDIVLEVAEEQYLGILSYVRGIETGSAEDLRSVATRDWHLEAEDLLYDLVLHQLNCEAMAGVLADIELPDDSGEQYVSVVSAVSDLVASVVGTWTAARSAAIALAYMTETAASIRNGMSRLQAVRLDTATAQGAQEGVQIEDSLHQLTGPIIRRVLYGQGDPIEVRQALTQLRERLDGFVVEAQGWAEQGGDLIGTMLRDVTVITKPAKTGPAKTGPQRPSWR